MPKPKRNITLIGGDENYYKNKCVELLSEQLTQREALKYLTDQYEELRNKFKAMEIAVRYNQSTIANNRGIIKTWDIRTYTAKTSLDLYAMKNLPQKDIEQILLRNIVKEISSNIQHFPIDIEINEELGIALAEINLAKPHVIPTPEPIIQH